MILVDVNILIYAHRKDQEHHDFFRTRLEETLRKPEPFGLTHLVAGGFLRIVTHPRFPNGPTPLLQAITVLESVLQLPNVRWITAGDRHWEIMANLLKATKAKGKAVADAQHAAIAIEHAATWITRDTDFEPFTPHGLQLNLWSPTP